MDGHYSGQQLMYSFETEASKKPIERFVDSYEFSKEIMQEEKMMEEDIMRMSSCLADSKNVWILYYGFCFYVLSICESNSKLFSQLYLTVLEKGEKPTNFITIYCLYCLKSFKLQFKCYDTNKMAVSFYGSFREKELSPVEKKYYEIMSYYNNIWWYECHLMDNIVEEYDESPDLNRIVYEHSINRIVQIIHSFYFIASLFNVFDDVNEEILHDITADFLSLDFTKEDFEFLYKIGTCICSLPEDYLILSLSDLFIILCHLVQYKNGVSLIQDSTDRICKKNNYIDGIELRKKVLEQDYSIQTIKWIKSYLSRHIWINV